MYKMFTKFIASAAGSRAWPQKSMDTKLGIRIDYGDIFTDSNGVQHRNYVIQPNKNTENEALKKLANENSHQKLFSYSLAVDPEHPSCVGMTDKSLAGTNEDGLFK